FAVRPLGNWIAAKVKIRAPRVAIRPTASLRGERANLLGGGSTWIGRCRLDQGLRFDRPAGFAPARPAARGIRIGVAICPGGDRDGGLLDLSDRDRPGG